MSVKSGFVISAVLQKIMAVIFGATLVVLNVIRILNIPITCDENGYSGKGDYDSYIGLAQDKFGSANNHILHSLFRKFFVDNFGNTLFTLRVDSLLAQISFLIFSYLICRLLFENRWWQLGGYIILNLVSPLIFNFWGLSRGYGLALSFMTISVYFLLKYTTDRKALSLILSFFGAILSVYSNFGYINYYLTLCGVLVIQFLLFPDSRKKNSFIRELLILVFSSGILALLIVGPLQCVYRNGELAFMGNSGFIHDTVVSVVTWGLELPGQSREAQVEIITWLAIALTVIFGIFWCYTFLRKYRISAETDVPIKYGVTFFLLLILPVISLIAQHLLFGINYLTDRAALFFIILFMLNTIYVLYCIRGVSKMLSTAVFLAVFLLTSYNFCSKANVNTTILWYFNAGDLAILRKINSETNKPGKLKLGVSWISETALRYDIEHYYPGKLYPPVVISHLPAIDTTFDYFYVDLDDFKKLPVGYERDTSCIGGGFVLLKKIEKLPGAK